MCDEKALPVPRAAAYLGIGRSLLYGEMAAGRLASVKIGRRRLILRRDLIEYLERHRTSTTNSGSVEGEADNRGDRLDSTTGSETQAGPETDPAD
jgi:excisionase family DNA binding protein